MDEIVEYIGQFPYDEYEIKHVPEHGSFYIDRIDDCIKNYIRKGVQWEGDLTHMMKLRIPPQTTVVDVGAHIGTHTVSLAQVAGKVIAFEPQPKLFRELVMNVRLNRLSNVELHWAGVGDTIGTIELSPLVTNNEGGTTLMGKSGLRAPLVTLDSMQLENISLIKIDVEDMENSVLDGAVETITRNQPTIFIEIVSGVNFRQATPDQLAVIHETLHRLVRLGYIVFPLYLHNYIAIPQGAF
jgi:FkbM family methyltransferase